MRKICGVAAIILLACSGNLEPGRLTKTMRDSESQRVYQTCMQQRGNQATLRRHCRKLYILAHANWAWEDCVNDGILDCGHRPRYEDIE